MLQIIHFLWTTVLLCYRNWSKSRKIEGSVFSLCDSNWVLTRLFVCCSHVQEVDSEDFCNVMLSVCSQGRDPRGKMRLFKVYLLARDGTYKFLFTHPLSCIPSFLMHCSVARTTSEF